MTTALTTMYAVTEAHPEGQATVKGGNWQDRAACRPGQGVDPDLFFPVAQVGPLYDKQVAEAKQVCFRCPAASDCLRDSLEKGNLTGVAGGFDERERQALHRRMTANANLKGIIR